jgi:hypothetical protein
MKLKFNLPSWCGLALFAFLAVGLSGCTTTTEYTYSYTDAKGATVEDSFTVNYEQTLIKKGIIGPDRIVAPEATESWDIPAGTVLSETALPYGADISLNGVITNKTGIAITSYEFLTTQCVEQACMGSGTPIGVKPNAQSCPAFASYSASCKKQVESSSSSTTCPASCSGNQRPALVMGNDGNAACQCATLTPPSCDNSKALSKRNADGSPAWDTCTPVELPATTLQANPNDPLLKQMMGTGSCKRVYSLVLHTYVCQ